LSEELAPALSEESARVQFLAPVRELAGELGLVLAPVLSLALFREPDQALVAMRV